MISRFSLQLLVLLSDYQTFSLINGCFFFSSQLSVKAVSLSLILLDILRCRLNFTVAVRVRLPEFLAVLGSSSDIDLSQDT